MKKKISALILSVIMLFSLCGCNALFIKKNSLIYLNDSSSSTTGFLTIDVNDYATIVENATLLYYSPALKKGVYTMRDQSGPRPVSYLYLFDENKAQLLLSGTASYTYAFIDKGSGSIYFKEYNSEELSTTLYRTDKSGSAKVKLTDTVTNRTMPVSVDSGTIAYINSENSLVISDNFSSTTVYTFDAATSVKKIAYSPKNNAVIALVSMAQKANVLYKVQLDTGELTAIDAGISDFLHMEEGNRLFYLKSAGTSEYLYTYDYSTYFSSYICSGAIDRFTVSPDGLYAAYATKSTSELPAQSVWIVTLSTGDATQLTASTQINGSLYFSSSDSLLFTQAQTTDAQSSAYSIKELEFSVRYSNEKQSEK